MPRRRELSGAAAGGAAAPPEPIRTDRLTGVGRGLSYGLYDLAWVLVPLLALPWLAWKALRRSGFATLVRERFGHGLGAFPRATRPRLLVHAVSVGEVKAARALIETLRERHPGFEVVLSTSTDTGLAVARQTLPGTPLVRFPFDFSPVVRRFLAAVDPALVILVELELWPGFLRWCNRQGRAVVVVNGRITSATAGRYRAFRLQAEFRRLSLLCVQSEEYAERFAGLGVEPGRLVVTGNVKFDGLRTEPVAAGEELTRLVRAGEPPGTRPVLVAGSTHLPEELLVARAARAARAPGPEPRLVLVPRHPPRASAVAEALAADGLRVQRLTELRRGGVPDPARPLLVDAIGELERLYALADLVYVGGSLVARGGQNMLEPAAQGRACVFGPHVENFRQEAALLLAAGAARQVPDAAALERELGRLLGDPGARAAMGRAGVQAVAAQSGATRRSLEALETLGLLDRDALLASARTGG